jgi:serine protease inhibitor
MYVPRTALLWAAITAGFLLVGTETLALSNKAVTASADNKFAFKLFSKSLDANGNLIMSPLSAFIVLGMTSNGAAGTTASSMANALQLSDPDLSVLNKQNAETLAALANSKSVLVANALFADVSTPFKDSFLDISKKVYGAHVQNLPFADRKSLKTINNWVSEHTAGKIPDMFNELSKDTRLILVNAVYFKGTWSHQFDPKATQKKDFHVSAGSTSSVDMMNTNDQLLYTKESNFQMVKIPYLGNKLSMYVMLPDPKVDFSSFAKGLQISDFNSAMQKLVTRQVSLALPKFKVESKRSLKGELSALGMPVAFNSEQADFSNLCKTKVWIGLVLQKAFVEVNEEGTTAAAATGVEMNSKGFDESPPQPVSLTIDRPFVFAIRDDLTKHIVFLGSVVNPSEEAK